MTYSVVRSCSACGTKNRIPAKHLASTGRCGACHESLPPASEPLEIDSVGTFRDIAREARVPILVDFWANWCAPCRMAAPEVHRLAKEMAGRALVLKVDTDRQPQLAAQYGARAIPHFVVLKNGRVAFEKSGLVRSSEMRAWLEGA